MDQATDSQQAPDQDEEDGDVLPEQSDRSVNYCVACFCGDYPVPFPGEKMLQLGLFEKE